jgi:hypothetical protein
MLSRDALCAGQSTEFLHIVDGITHFETTSEGMRTSVRLVEQKCVNLLKTRLITLITRMTDSSSDLMQMEFEHDGVRAQGAYRVLGTSVIVYFEDRGKFADCGGDDPAALARHLLSELMQAKGKRERQ